MNKERFNERIVYHMAVAREQLMHRRRVEADDEFVQTAILILPNGTEHELVLPFYNDYEQKA